MCQENLQLELFKRYKLLSYMYKFLFCLSMRIKLKNMMYPRLVFIKGNKKIYKEKGQ